MAFLIRPTTVDDEKRLTEFLTRVFSINADFASSAMLRWKYWTPRDDWPEPRSFWMERDGRVIAHAGLWPVTVRTGTKSERGVHFMDWAADPHARGAGSALIKDLTKNYDFVYGIGGEDVTRIILPKLGFRQIAEARTWARPIRPWRQMLRHQSKNWKLLPRFVRNFWWSRIPSRSVPRGWAVAAATADGFAILAAERDESFFRYLQQCPVATCLTFNIVNDGRIVGFFALLVIGEQARVAGVWLESPSPETWGIAFHLAQEAALQHTGASEIVARCTTEASAIGAQQAGMRLVEKIPVLLFRKDGFELLPPLQFHLCDSDALFLTGGFKT
jgi:GNAT superfamily N-acetyltransferase